MNKFLAVIFIICGVIGIELILLITIPLLSDMASTANTTIAASSNVTNYPGMQGFLLASPWLLYFVPPAIGITAIIFRLRAS